MKNLILKLEKEQRLSKEEWTQLIEGRTKELAEFLFERAREVRHAHYGREVYIRGLIEFTNYCRNDCYYCGIRKSNSCLSRYRLTEEEILSCCRNGYELGFRTFVLQGGEDGWFTRERTTALIRRIHEEFPDCAITLSVGEREREEYQEYFDAGANRFLLRHETADEEHYRYLHPAELSLKHRKECLWNLRHIGYQVGSGIMVGSPGQTAEHLAEDLLFLQELQPHMVGIGPFIPHKDTPFKEEKAGTLELTLFLLGLVRLMLPKVLMPATTALSTIHPDGRKMGILSGANVVMPNLSPQENRKLYSLYDNKRCMGDEAAEGLAMLRAEMEEIGYEIVSARGDALLETEQGGKL
ncbi:MAG: [FeFe] hydrogenase H-cluster radical SAM maturase HydE [Anaerotignum sp.]|nr:[FeFe] hydrogenase H-cluster radical SAM maturase HydE [Anaerotignum sp.]